MAPKKKGKGKDDEKKDELKLIDREFYIIQIEDLNRKVARLESKCTDMEAENEAVRASMEKLDEDRGDVISHLRRVLQRKVDEVSELTERIDALQTAKETEGSLYKEKIKNMEKDFQTMHEQLASEIKLLNGKLNSLEEFRSQREDLMTRFERQEAAIEEQERRQDQQLLDLEQSYLVRKERLKEEMEARLLKLSLDFQKATQMRIASTTQSVIRENIAVNNQLNILVAEWKKMCEEMEELKSQNKNLTINEEINRKERKIVERRNIIQDVMIKKLSREGLRKREQLEQVDVVMKQLSTTECELSESRRCERLAIQNLGLAKQQLHALAVSYNELRVNQNKLQSHSYKLEAVLSKATLVVRQVLELSAVGESDEGTIIRRAQLLKTLEELLDWEAVTRQLNMRDTFSVETLPIDKAPVEKYHAGDLGIVPARPEGERAAEQVDQDPLLAKMTANNELNALYIEKLEEYFKQARSFVNEITLLPEAQTRLLKEEVKERREELLGLLMKTLDLSLLQTPRPHPLPSLESISLEEGLITTELDVALDKEKVEELGDASFNTICSEAPVIED